MKSYSHTVSGQNAGFDMDFTFMCATPAMRVSLIIEISLFYILF